MEFNPEPYLEEVPRKVTAEAACEESEAIQIAFYITFIGTMIFFFFCAALMEKYHPRIGHETTATLIFGIVFSIIFYAAN